MNKEEIKREGDNSFSKNYREILENGILHTLNSQDILKLNNYKSVISVRWVLCKECINFSKNLLEWNGEINILNEIGNYTN